MYVLCVRRARADGRVIDGGEDGACIIVVLLGIQNSKHIDTLVCARGAWKRIKCVEWHTGRSVSINSMYIVYKLLWLLEALSGSQVLFSQKLLDIVQSQSLEFSMLVQLDPKRCLILVRRAQHFLQYSSQNMDYCAATNI